jgi:hypothetical protein
MYLAKGVLIMMIMTTQVLSKTNIFQHLIVLHLRRRRRRQQRQQQQQQHRKHFKDMI